MTKVSFFVIGVEDNNGILKGYLFRVLQKIALTASRPGYVNSELLLKWKIKWKCHRVQFDSATSIIYFCASFTLRYCNG